MTDDANNDSDTLVDFTYIPSESLANGALVDVTAAAVQAGVTCPVFVSLAAYDHCVAVPANSRWQDLELRLWHMLWDMSCEARLQDPDGDVLHYELFVPINPNAGRVELKAVSCLKDDASRFLTIMLRGEELDEVWGKP